MKKGIIFDFDGTIANTMNIHNDIEIDILKRYNIPVTKAWLRRNCAGVSFELTMKKLFEENNILDADPSILIQEKRERMFEKINTDLRLMPGVLELIKLLKANGHKLIIGTSSRHAFVDKCVELLNISEYFTHIVCAEDVNDKTKPAPDIFLRCAQLLDIKPEDCIVIEDGLNGIIAANTANMKSIAYAYDEADLEFPATKTIMDFSELTIEDFK